MEPLCAHERRRCVNHGMEDWPLVEVIRNSSDFEKNVTHLLLLYVMSGSVDVSYGTVVRHRLRDGDLMLFPPGTRLHVHVSGPPMHSQAHSPADVMLLKVQNRLVLCDRYVFGLIWRDFDVSALIHSHLSANSQISVFMELLAENVEGPLNCFRFMDIKIMELFHLLRAYYEPSELASFTQPLMSPNSQFMYFIWNNYRKVRNVNEFARLANCSLSAFKVKFRHVTGMAPSQWLAQQKARNVFHEISTGEKSLKEISEEYHFSSVSHLGTFCRKNFGQSPGNLKPGAKPGTKPGVKPGAKSAEKSRIQQISTVI